MKVQFSINEIDQEFLAKTHAVSSNPEGKL